MFTVSTAGFVPGRGTTDAILIVRQLQEKYIAVKKPFYFAFVDLEKAFDRMPRKVLWWALRSLGVEEWAVRVIQGMYVNARSRVRVNGQYSEEFGVVWVLASIKGQFSAHFSSFWCWRRCRVSSVLVSLGSSCMPMILWSRTLWRSAFPSCGSGKLGWRVKV